jgi:hypothetical protein
MVGMTRYDHGVPSWVDLGDESKAIDITPASDIGFVALARTLFATYPKRSILGAALMITQSFLYNAIFFT